MNAGTCLRFGDAPSRLESLDSGHYSFGSDFDIRFSDSREQAPADDECQHA
jgi:hypothetical protein